MKRVLTGRKELMNYKTIELKYGRNIIATAQEPKDLQSKLIEIANSFDLGTPDSKNDFGDSWSWEKELVRCDLRIIRNTSCYAIQLFLSKKNGIEQLKLIRVQPEIPKTNIKQIGKPLDGKDGNNLDIFKQAPAGPDIETINLFKEDG